MLSISSARLALELGCLALCAVAAVIDVRSYRIPNWLTFAGIALGLALRPLCFGLAGGFELAGQALVSGFAGSLLLLCVFAALATLRAVGMGDVKLLCAVGAWLGWPAVLSVLVTVALAGGVVAVAFALLRGRLVAVLGNLRRLGDRSRLQRAGHRIPYGVAILVGVAWTVLGHHYPAVRLL